MRKTIYTLNQHQLSNKSEKRTMRRLSNGRQLFRTDSKIVDTPVFSPQFLSQTKEEQQR